MIIGGSRCSLFLIWVRFKSREMSETGLHAAITKIAKERFKEEDLSDCFLLSIEQNAKKLEVYVDSDDGVKFWQCQKLSRAIEEYLDESQALGEDYTLEVSSPGIDKPLQLQRQYPRNIGRELEVTLKEEEAMVTGKLLEVDEEGILIKAKGAKKGQFKEKRIAFSDIIATRVLVSFKKKKK